jgi:hypothetical protein
VRRGSRSREVTALKITLRATLLTVCFPLAGWALCAAVMGIGMALLPMQTVLIVHAVAAPAFFTVISLLYFSRFRQTNPLVAASLFTVIVMVADFLVVALLVLRSLDMFRSVLGTWIPFGLIFASTLVTGLVVRGRTQRREVERRIAM